MVTRQIRSHRDLGFIFRFNKLMGKFKEQSPENLPKPLLCPIHNGEVKRTPVPLDKSPPQVISGIPPFEYVFEGCCDEAIDSELNFIRDFVANNSGNR